LTRNANSENIGFAIQGLPIVDELDIVLIQDPMHEASIRKAQSQEKSTNKIVVVSIAC